ncbi:MAG: hypothetical protein JJT89_12380 [Nitriliruptoraceae bacterium]|nr:hypothetical protein [Nitriliruptoraceae bacterium]
MLYLAYADHDDPPDVDELVGPWHGVQRLRAGLWLLASDLHRSAVYHGLKDALPRDTPLLVARCDEVPKFKGMDAGASAWARHHVGR